MNISDPYSLLIAFGAFLGILLIIAFFFSLDLKQTNTRFLILLVVLLTVAQIGRFAYQEAMNLYDKRWLMIPDLVLFTFGPIFYLYIKSTLFRDQQVSWKTALHFIPFGLQLLRFTYLIFGVEREAFWDLINNPANMVIGMLMLAMALGSISVYLILSWRLLIRFKRTSLKEHSSWSNVGYIQTILILIAISFAAWMEMLIVGAIGQTEFDFHAYGLIWMGFTLIVFGLGFFALTKPEVFRVAEPIKKYESSKLNQADLERLKIQVDLYMQSRKPYLNQKLAKSDLSKEMELPAPDLSRVLNEGFGMNFFEYINSHRIKEFIRLVESQEYTHLTLFGIAQEAGFHSKSTFYKAFKEITGRTPTKYFQGMNP